MKNHEPCFPAWREAAVVNTTDPEKLGRIQLRIFPELAEISEADLPWCFPMSGGVHCKSFCMPLIGQLVYAVIFSKYFNEIVFLPFNITKPTEHLFDNWMNDRRSEITDMEVNPEEEHLVVEEFDDDFTEFHDTKNSQHGYLHPSGTYFVINKDGSVWMRSIKKCTFHNKDSDLFIEVDPDTGNVTFKTKGSVDEIVNKNWNIAIFGEASITANDKLSITAKDDIKINGKKMTDIESGSDMTLKAGNELRLKGMTVKIAGLADKPSGKGGFCALTHCLATGASHSTDTINNAI